jgi:hypothetical protein
MALEFSGDFINCYEYLNQPQNATIETLQAGFEQLTASTQKRLNNPLTSNNALYIHNVVEPAIRQYLLSGSETRAAYDHLLTVYQQQQARRNELADEEGLDDFLERPFFFDPFDFDTETPANSLREIALKLDEEWARACKWLANNSDEVHIFLSFLIHSANRPGLAKRIEPVIKAVNGKNSERIGVNEAVERCILLLNPQAERPLMSVHNATLDGKVWQAGEFIPDVPARGDLIIGHDGLRGCVFGTIESRTDWVKFEGNLSKARFSLMPEGTEQRIGRSEIQVPCVFQINEARFVPYTSYQAEILIRMENHSPVREILLPVDLAILPIPPRVVFAPPALPQQPVWVGIARQGEPAAARVTAFNRTGNEALVPLAGRITTRDPAASVEPQTFQHQSQITLTIDTKNRPRGQRYEVIFDLDYEATPGAQGPATLHVQGEIVPTTWQSMKRIESTEMRIGLGIVGLFIGAILLLICGSILASAGGQAWLMFLLLPLIFGCPAYFLWKTLLAHRRLAGETPSTPEQISPWLIWTIPSAIGALFFFLCASIGGWTVLITVLLGGLAGGIFGFIKDGVLAKAAKQQPPPMH